ncbi:MAG: transposase [Nitrospira sp.]|nr:transposase [Nitrospira sp.]
MSRWICIPWFGYQRIWVLLRREGWAVNQKRVRRWYRLDGIQLRMRVRCRKHRALHRGQLLFQLGPLNAGVWISCMIR